jgi:NADH dehydrogenase
VPEVYSEPKLVTIFGGSGFLGRHIVQALARRRYLIRVACRRPNLAVHLQPLGATGQIMPVQANVRHRESVERAVEGASHVINLVAILHESGRQKFSAIHEAGARAVAEAARSVGARMTHISAIGADPASPSAYARTKAAGEAAVREILPEATILRPSIVFGPEDQFFNRFAGMARLSPVLPLIGGGHTRFQPVYVVDIAEAVARDVDGRVQPGRIWELGGPEILTFRQCMERMLAVIERRRLLVSIPWSLAMLQAFLLELLPSPPLTRDQVRLLKIDNVVSEAAIRESRTLAGLGIEPHLLDAILPTYLWTYRRTGQFISSKLS